MASHQISLLNASINLLSTWSGYCYWEQNDVPGANDVWRYNALVLEDPPDGQYEGIYGTFQVPQNYRGSPEIVVIWNATVTSGDVRLRWYWRTVCEGEAVDVENQPAANLLAWTDTVAGTARLRMVTSLSSIPASEFIPDATVTFFFERSHDGGADTMAGKMYVHDILFKYSDT